MPPQVRGVPRYDHDVGRPGCDLLLTTGTEVGLAGLGGVYAPDVEAKRLAGGLQVRNLL
jgi:hypothetical protein